MIDRAFKLGNQIANEQIGSAYLKREFLNSFIKGFELAMSASEFESKAKLATNSKVTGEALLLLNLQSFLDKELRK